jgi:hypothetical protein
MILYSWSHVATIIDLHGIHIKLNLVAMKKHLVYVIGSLIILINPCVQGQSLVALKLLKSSIDIKLNSPKANPTVIVKTSNNKLIQIKNKNWPDSVVTTYNILKDVSGKIIAFREEPNIESGDDSFEKTYYFNGNGKTFAIELFHGRIDNDGQGATGGAIRGTETMYYDEKFNLLFKAERFTDGKNHPLQSINGYDFYLDSNLYSNSNSCFNQLNEFEKVSYESTLPRINDFFIPKGKYNKVKYTHSEDKPSDLLSTAWYKKVGNGYEITTASFFQGHTMGIETRTIAFRNNQVLILKTVVSNALGVTNRHRQFNPPLILLKMPSKDKSTSWTYISPEGDRYSCKATLSSQEKEGQDGQTIDESVIKVVMVMPAHPQFKTIDYYQKGYGLTKEEVVSKEGTELIFMATEFSEDDSKSLKVDEVEPNSTPENTFQQNPNIESDPNQIHTNVEQEPAFQGNFGEYLSKNIKYPDFDYKSGTGGKVIVQFVVEIDGSLSNFKVFRTPDETLAQEALRVLKLSPKWHPGISNGIPVRTQCIIPISFNLPNVDQ